MNKRITRSLLVWSLGALLFIMISANILKSRLVSDHKQQLASLKNICIGKTGYLWIVDGKDGPNKGRFILYPTLQGQMMLQAAAVVIAFAFWLYFVLLHFLQRPIARFQQAMAELSEFKT